MTRKDMKKGRVLTGSSLLSMLVLSSIPFKIFAADTLFGFTAFSSSWYQGSAWETTGYHYDNTLFKKFEFNLAALDDIVVGATVELNDDLEEIASLAASIGYGDVYMTYETAKLNGMFDSSDEEYLFDQDNAASNYNGRFLLNNFYDFNGIKAFSNTYQAYSISYARTAYERDVPRIHGISYTKSVHPANIWVGQLSLDRNGSYDVEYIDPEAETISIFYFFEFDQLRNMFNGHTSLSFPLGNGFGFLIRPSTGFGLAITEASDIHFDALTGAIQSQIQNTQSPLNDSPIQEIPDFEVKKHYSVALWGSHQYGIYYHKANSFMEWGFSAGIEIRMKAGLSFSDTVKMEGSEILADPPAFFGYGPFLRLLGKW